MLTSLYGKLVAVLVGFALITIVSLVLVMRQSDTTRRLEVSQGVYRPYAAQLVRERLFPEDGPDAAAFTRVFDRLKVVVPRLDAYLVDANGAILATSSKGASLKRKQVDMQPVRRFLEEDAVLPIVGDDPTDDKVQRAFTATRLVFPGHEDAYLYMVIKGIRSDSTAQQILQSYVLRRNLLVVGGGVLFALLAGAFILALLMRRLQRLARVMDRFRESGFAENPGRAAPRAPAGDEIDRLATTFNEMADRILDQVRALKQTDSMRRELVVNISHDLRTPIASLQGHLETLQAKGDRLSEEEKRGYLEIALRQTVQLGQLVARLFELAKLDSEQAALLREPFVLADLVQDVVQQFELAAADKGIRIGAQLPLEMPLVSADIGLIERALRNLIENSLRYTPEGGEITVGVIAGPAHATVRVTDTGCGIDAADLPRIFDRFYRGEKSRSDHSGNAGLGLAITRRILELHESAIDVTSQPGLTEISFTLAYAEPGPGLRPAPESPTEAPAAHPAALGAAPLKTGPAAG